MDDSLESFLFTQTNDKKLSFRLIEKEEYVDILPQMFNVQCSMFNVDFSIAPLTPYVTSSA